MNATHAPIRVLGLRTLLCIVFLGAPAAPLFAQGWNFKDLTRTQLWARVWNTSGVGQPTLYGEEYYKFDYPGHELGSNIYDHGGWVEFSGYMAWAEIDGVGYPFRVNMAYDPNPNYIAPLENAELVENYNMADPSLKAEEILTGAHRIVEFGLDVHFRVLAWSYPTYDDFLIYEYTFTNTTGKTIRNFRFAPTAGMRIANPITGRTQDDDYESLV